MLRLAVCYGFLFGCRKLSFYTHVYQRTYQQTNTKTTIRLVSKLRRRLTSLGTGHLVHVLPLLQPPDALQFFILYPYFATLSLSQILAKAMLNFLCLLINLHWGRGIVRSGAKRVRAGRMEMKRAERRLLTSALNSNSGGGEKTEPRGKANLLGDVGVSWSPEAQLTASFGLLCT